MAIFIRPADWNQASSYIQGQEVHYNGVGYRATGAVAGGGAIPPGNTNWESYVVFEITDWYSLQEDIFLTSNKDIDVVGKYIPASITDTEVALSKFLRSPAQRVQRRFTSSVNEDQETFFQLPTDVIEIEHLRWDNNEGSDRTLRERGSINITKSLRDTYEEIRQYYEGNPFYSGDTYEYPVWYEESGIAYIAPAYSGPEDFLLTYWQKVPQLGQTGRTTRIVNDVAVPTNAAGQTMEEFLTANPGGTFVQGTETVTRNLWTATIPRVLKAGAMAEIYRFLEENEQETVWRTRFDELVRLTVEEFKKFETSGQQTSQQKVGYCG